MITPFGVEKNEHSLATVSHQLVLEDLFGLRQPAFLGIWNLVSSK